MNRPIGSAQIPISGIVSSVTIAQKISLISLPMYVISVSV